MLGVGAVTATPRPQLGAGSAIRGSWPDTPTQVGAGASVRSPLVGTGVSSISGAIAISGGLHKGRTKTALNSTAAPTGALSGTLSAVTFARERPAGLIQTDLECWAFRSTHALAAALAAPLGTNRDCGLILGKAVRQTSGITGGVNYSGGGGVSFGPSGPGALRFVMRNDAGAITVNVDVTPDGYGETDWHTYELRLIGGTPSADPYVQGFLDGVAVTEKYSATAAAALFCNPYDAPANVNAYFAAAANLTNGDVPTLYVHRWTIAGGRTEADLY